MKSRKTAEVVASVNTAGPSRLESLLVLLTVAAALWIFLSSVKVSRFAWVAIPTVDDWDRWITFIRDHYSLRWFFEQHVDHRLAAPKLLLAIDHLVFHARGWFPLVCSFCFQALTGCLLWRLAGHAYRQERMERLMQSAVIACFVFSGQQWINFIWPFQVVFPMVYCAAAAALFALWKSATGRNGAWWIAMSIAMATVATYTMANGVLVWPVLLLAAVWLRVPRRWIGALAAGSILLGATYFYHWHRAAAPPQRPPSERFLRAVFFGLAHLGSPTTTIAVLRHDDSFRLTFAAIFGTVLALALLMIFVMLWRRRERYNGAHAVLIFYCVFIIGATATMAYGRAEGPLLEAFSPRYLTPSNILWACMLLVIWPLLRRVNRVALYGTLCALMFLGIAVHQRRLLDVLSGWVTGVHLAETAVVDNVADTEVLHVLFHTPTMIAGAADYLKTNHLSIFTEEWTHWPGIQLNQRFSLDPNPKSCQGKFEPAMIVPSNVKRGWRVTGWAWDNKTEVTPRYIVLAGDSGQIAGVALTGFPPSASLAAVSSRYDAASWKGYVNGEPRSITAYVLEADDRSLCSIGTQPLPASGAEETALTTTAPGKLSPLGISTNLTRSDVATAFYLDFLGPVSNPATQNVVLVAGDTSLAIIGWAIDYPKKATAGGVDVMIDELPYNATYGIPRTDVANILHNLDYRDSGFQLILPPGQLSQGPHSISIRVISNDSKSYHQGPAIKFSVR